MRFIIAGLFISFLVSSAIINVGISALFAILTMLFCYAYDKRICIVYWFAILMFSNIIIAWFSPFINEKIVFDYMRGMDFLLICFFSILVFVQKLVSSNKLVFNKNILFLSLLIVVYYFYGLSKIGFSGATTYLRYFLYPILLYFIREDLLFAYRDKLFKSFLVFSYSFFCLYITIEFFIPEKLYSILNMYDFVVLKYPERFIPNLQFYVDSRIITIFRYNDIWLEGFRANGPLMHAISSGYTVAMISILLAFLYRKIIFLFVGLLITFMLLSKGPMLLILIAFFAMFLYRFGLLNKLSVNALKICVIMLTIILVYIGIVTLNPHHYSLLSSIIYLPAHIIGGGIGVGGTISTGTTYSVDLEKSSGDSALALFINMFGFIGLLTYAVMLKKSFSRKLFLDLTSSFSISNFLSIIFLVLLCNGVSQEEALNPYVVSLFAIFLAAVKLKKDDFFYKVVQ